MRGRARGPSCLTKESLATSFEATCQCISFHHNWQRGQSATDADPAARRDQKRESVRFLLYVTVLPVSFFSLIVSGCKSEHDAERVVPKRPLYFTIWWRFREHILKELRRGFSSPIRKSISYAKVSGFVRRINVDIGDKVRGERFSRS